MQIQLYLDEDASARAVAHNLRVRRVDVTTVREQGRTGLPDSEQLDYATQQGRVICTCNISDFVQLHTEYMAQGKNHAGIILIHQQHFSIGEQVRRLLRLMQSRSAEAMVNNIEYLSNW
jgi:predicted nuclease of predicted toxin-antitoxin system